MNQTIEHSLLSIHEPNARPELLPEAGAQRTLEAVGCRPWFGHGTDLLRAVCPFRYL